MLNSFFLLAPPNGTVIIEKHWRVVISRSVVDQFMSEVNKAGSPEEVLPIIAIPKMYLIHVYRDGLFYLAIITSEVSPLLVLEFLHRMADIFQEYFGEVSETSIKENFVTVYQLLEELLDNGFPLTTETNILKEMILPPSIMNLVVTTVTGSSNINNKLPSNTMSSIPWRKTNLKYNNNEIYFDIIEAVDAIVDSNGQIISSEIQGEIQCNCRLSGMPDLTLIFSNPRILDDVSLHPCVRIARFERERVISFVPPDGIFKLMNYRVNSGTNMQLPLLVRPSVSFINNSGKIDVTVRPQSTGGKQLENVRLAFPLPQAVLTVNISVNHGSYEYDVGTKMLKWDLGRIPKERTPTLTGSIVLQSGSSVDGRPIIDVDFKLNMFATSGLKVDTVQLVGESYKPYKGVRAITKAGKYQIRS